MIDISGTVEHIGKCGWHLKIKHIESIKFRKEIIKITSENYSDLQYHSLLIVLFADCREISNFSTSLKER